ncbi:transcriptional adapter 3-B-like isoform X2 [Acanthaster planci]|uniref:Transcriptional adapter 3-B-like isoform X2 n=1 Tax=Acanthaster planci TaxID=133434 RepID=A0A8B7YLF3_ACAPL|nr:transcriptional adapter 3-B-like isoform X2 [Acanthaster planci]
MKMTEVKDCPLQFQEFVPVDHEKSCPRYTTVLQRDDDDGIIIDELDTLQLELETLLASVSKRMLQLETENKTLIDWLERRDKKGAATPTPASGKGKPKDEPTTPSGKRSRVEEKPDKPEKPPKKIKESGGKQGAMAATATTVTPVTSGRPKAKSMHQKLQEYEFTDDPLAEPLAPRIPRNDAPDRFWTSVEPYCTDITNEDVKVLDDMLKTSDDDMDYFKIPPLGKHYALRWAQEDLLEEQKEGSKMGDKKKGSVNSANSKETKALLKKAESREEDICPFGPLTQRLISALVEENIMTPIEDIISETTPKINDQQTLMPSFQSDGPDSKDGISPKNGNRFTVPHTRALEARLREELLHLGLLDADDPVTDDTDDEILVELQKRQAELRALSAHNRSQKMRLYRLAKEEMKRQEVRQKLRAADNEAMDAFRRIMAAKQKKRSPTKKERDQAWKVIKEREALVKQLESM